MLVSMHTPRHSGWLPGYASFCKLHTTEILHTRTLTNTDLIVIAVIIKHEDAFNTMKQREVFRELKR